MSETQIYYISNTDITGFEIEPIIHTGPKTYQEIKNEIESNDIFCREGESITIKHLLGAMGSSNILYALKNDRIAGVLVFMFNVNKNGQRIIVFDGICSPTEYSGLGIGQQLIETLIRIGKINDVKYINLECNGKVMNYYKNKFNFEIIEETIVEDSDADSEDEEEGYYYMRLDLSRITGGKKRRCNIKTKRSNIKTKSKSKRRCNIKTKSKRRCNIKTKSKSKSKRKQY